MNGGHDLANIFGELQQRVERNLTMGCQQAVNAGFIGVSGTVTLKFVARSPDGSGKIDKSISLKVSDLVAGNGPAIIGGNGQVSLDDALATVAASDITTDDSDDDDCSNKTLAAPTSSRPSAFAH